MIISWFNGLKRSLVKPSEIVYDIVIDVIEELEISDWPFSERPLVGTGPLTIEDGLTGNSMLVETGHTNLIIDSSFEDGF